MSKPESFILDTDFPTLKNDANGNATIIIPGSLSIAANTSYVSNADINIGVQGAVSRGRIQSTINSNEWQVGQLMYYFRTGTILGNPAFYTVYAFFYRVSPTILRAQIYIPNGQTDTLIGEATTQTVNFYANTFLPPFA